MSFGTIFATIVFAAILIFSSYLLATSTIFTMNTLSQSFKKANDMQNGKLKTEIEIVNVSVSDAQNITVVINNTGKTKILNDDFMYIDVFVYYDIVGAAERYTFKWIPYTETYPPENDHWTVVSISPDSVNPRNFDPDEQMKIWIRVLPRIESGTTGWIEVVTPNGISASSYFYA